jgi:hypothetical protein
VVLYDLVQSVSFAWLLVFVNACRKIHKRTDTDVAFTREYSRVSISTRNVKCTRENQEHLRKEKVNMFLRVERNYLKFSNLILSN